MGGRDRGREGGTGMRDRGREGGRDGDERRVWEGETEDGREGRE